MPIPNLTTRGPWVPSSRCSWPRCPMTLCTPIGAGQMLCWMHALLLPGLLEPMVGAAHAGPMATTIPSNAAIHTLLEEAARGDPAAKQRLQQLEDDQERFDLEDYRTVSTDRGPVRGYQGGARRL